MGFVELSVLDGILDTTCMQECKLINMLCPKVCCMLDAYLLIVRNVYVHI